MKWRSFFLALATGAAATLLVAQEVTTKQTTIQSSENPRIVTITGEVVKYEPGQTIVLRQPDKRVVTYTLSPGAILPARHPDRAHGDRVHGAVERRLGPGGRHESHDHEHDTRRPDEDDHREDRDESVG